jgi:ribosomal protein L11 methyltransferase
MRSWPALELRFPAHEKVGGGFSRLDLDLLQAALLDYDLAAIDETTPDAWRVFFQSSAARDRAVAGLHEQFPGIAISLVDVPDEDWAARSQSELRAVRVGNIVVAPPWDVRSRLKPAPTENGLITIIIQPSMGFGTGHHATTRLCLAALQQLDLLRKTVVDVGTGSGVLAIAASRLGAGQVLAIDDDEDAIQSARENLALNSGANVTLGVFDVRATTLRPFDVVLANLTSALLMSAAQTLLRLAKPAGHLILSGLMEAEERDVLDALREGRVQHRSQEDEWVCVTLRAGGGP